MDEPQRTYTVFEGERLVVAAAELREMLLRAKAEVDRGADRLLIFEDETGAQVDFDFRGTPGEVVERAVPPPPKGGPGRPKLGVISREISLLPRHWEWLEAQPEGISAAIRRLVDEARKREPGKARARRVREAASKIMWVMAGNLPGFEEASRALFAKDSARFESLVREWPADLRDDLLRRMRDAEALEE